jgi:hypothetical protein
MRLQRLFSSPFKKGDRGIFLRQPHRPIGTWDDNSDQSVKMLLYVFQIQNNHAPNLTKLAYSAGYGYILML